MPEPKRNNPGMRRRMLRRPPAQRNVPHVALNALEEQALDWYLTRIRDCVPGSEQYEKEKQIWVGDRTGIARLVDNYINHGHDVEWIRALRNLCNATKDISDREIADRLFVMNHDDTVALEMAKRGGRQ